jgi:hypothetical protein
MSAFASVGSISAKPALRNTSLRMSIVFIVRPPAGEKPDPDTGHS